MNTPTFKRTLFMKMWLAVLGLLSVSSYVASAQLPISAGETWTYQFIKLPFVGIKSGALWGPSWGSAHVTLSSIAPGTHYTFSIYEDNLSQAPIMVTDSLNNQSDAAGGINNWQDLQGWAEVKVISGALTIDDIEFDVYIGTALYTDNYYSEIIPVVPPKIQSSPLTQTVEVGTPVDLSVRATGFDPLVYLWYFNHTNLIGHNTNNFHLQLTNLQFFQSGAYSVVVTNVVGAVTSSPAMLNVISAVQRSAVPGISVTGKTGSSVNVQFTDSPGSSSGWQALDTTTLTLSPQYWFDLSTPLPQQRFYRIWQTGTPTVLPSSKLISMVPAITLTGNIGNSVRVDYINAIGPTSAWVTLGTVALTNTAQLYFDVAAPSQPKRLYRLVQVP
jgi:hypothetical protein